jgi:hypothetical protein
MTGYSLTTPKVAVVVAVAAVAVVVDNHDKSL